MRILIRLSLCLSLAFTASLAFAMPGFSPGFEAISEAEIQSDSPTYSAQAESAQNLIVSGGDDALGGNSALMLGTVEMVSVISSQEEFQPLQTEALMIGYSEPLFRYDKPVVLA